MKTMDLQDAAPHIGRFHARHHAADAAGQQRALAAQRRLLDGELEAALARVAAPGELLLLRRLHTRVVLGRAGSEHQDARAWGDAVLLSLETTLQHAGPQDLLRLASPQQALREFAADVLHDHGARDWAWQRLSLLPANHERQNSPAQRRQALMHLLADDAEQGVPLLRSLLGGPHWPLLVARLHEGELRGLAQAVLSRLAGVAAPGFGEGLAAPGWVPEPVRALPRHNGATPASRPDWWRATQQAAGTGTRALWAQRLACMLSAPALARQGAAAVDMRLQHWMPSAGDTVRAGVPQALQAAAGIVTVQPPDPAKDADADADADAAADAEATPHRSAPGVSAPDPQHAEQAHTATPATARVRPPHGHADAATDAEASPSCHTQWGGLLFLAPLLPACGALSLLEEDPTLWPDLPQALHALALQLAPLRPQDPAALAFCGLAPAQAPPRPLPLSAAHLACLQQAQLRLHDHLWLHLPDWRGPDLLLRVLQRDARISADPGWIDVQFPLREVAIELRRAALDLDPGFLPWLGVVLRFRYE